MEFKKRYLVNVNTKNIHDTENIQKGCHINRMKDSNAMFFDTLQEASEYPKTSKCKYCFND